MPGIRHHRELREIAQTLIQPGEWITIRRMRSGHTVRWGHLHTEKEIESFLNEVSDAQLAAAGMQWTPEADTPAEEPAAPADGVAP